MHAHKFSFIQGFRQQVLSKWLTLKKFLQVYRILKYFFFQLNKFFLSASFLINSCINKNVTTTSANVDDNRKLYQMS